MHLRALCRVSEKQFTQFISEQLFTMFTITIYTFSHLVIFSPSIYSQWFYSTFFKHSLDSCDISVHTYSFYLKTPCLNSVRVCPSATVGSLCLQMLVILHNTAMHDGQRKESRRAGLHSDSLSDVSTGVGALTTCPPCPAGGANLNAIKLQASIHC